MKTLHTLSIGIALFSQSGFAANDCIKDGGSYLCIPANPPQITGAWRYTSATFKTPIEGRATLGEAVQDLFKAQEQMNNWNLKGVGSYSIVSEEVKARLSHNQEPTRIALSVSGPFEHYNSNGELHWIGSWSWRFSKGRASQSWTCNNGYREINKSPRPTSPKEAPFDCGLIEPLKNQGCSASVGNPCSVITGNKFLRETDWSSSTSPLVVYRFYSSLPDNDSRMAAGWTHNYAMSLSIGVVQNEDDKLNLEPQSLEESTSVIVLKCADGKRVLAVRDYTDATIAGDSGWFIDRDEGLKLEQINSNRWQVTHVDTGQVETYKSLITDIPDSEPSEFVLTRIDHLDGQHVTLTYDQGRLYQATDNFGHTLTYEYAGNSDIKGISTVTLPSGKQIRYSKQGNELTVTRPGYGTKTYLYDEPEYAPNPNGFVTGIIDENSKRYATYSYDDHNRGVSTEHANTSQKYTLVYSANRTTVSTPYGGSKTYTLGLVSGSNKVTYTSQSGDSVSNQYDKAGNIISKTDNGILS